MILSQSLPLTPSRLYRVKKRVIIPQSSQKTIKIAKRLKSCPGLPKPLSSEEDFMLESRDSYNKYLSPLSSFYELPLPQLTKSQHASSFAEFNPRNIVGPFEAFKKHWKSINEFKEKELIRKNRSFIAFTNPNLAKNQNFFRTEADDDGKEPAKYTKVHILYEKQQDYWKRINQNIERKVTVKRMTKKNNFLTVPKQF